ncbi:hypothetical protein AQUCO_02500138v1 [Aquilegia coerulea]|uniref:Uncharacterized protein n=1 Tax=Aquilegia coerulea TaxID=218851 RepID=A0A2G5D9P1_AQUCA|nr:hypothetical protein AQUCO_02500138v1 [Aquilegia coerulea]
MAKFASWMISTTTTTTTPFFKVSSCFNASILVPSHTNTILFPLNSQYPFLYISTTSFICHAKKKTSPLLKPTNTTTQIVQSLEQEEEEETIDFVDDFHDGTLTDADDLFEEEEEAELYVGDGAGGGGISFAGTEWDKKALAIAEDTILSFNGELKIYAFQTLKNSTIRVRIEKLSNRSGSPSMADIEEFSSAYRVKLDEAEQAGSIPQNTYLEVSSPGVERIVRIPQDLDRFKERPMYVKYVTEGTAAGLTSECDGVFKLVSFDLESGCCTWGIADVRKNREKAGKGRPLSKKQREWRLNTPFDSLRLVRIFSEC